MKLYDYYKQVLVPANSAIAAIRRSGLPIDLGRVYTTQRAWEGELKRLEREVEAEARRLGGSLRFTAAHATEGDDIRQFLYSPKGLNLDIYAYTDKKHVPATDDDALRPYASIANPWPEDNPWVYKLLKIRSLAKGIGTYLRAFAELRRADGAVHPQFNWAVVRTARISAENPPVHQIPERADPEVADGVKACIVPRVNPARVEEEWDPRRHGSCFRWDIAGAEAAIRAAMLVRRDLPQPGILWDYIRNGKDVHGLTASLIFGKPEGCYGKGTPERDKTGKQTFFAKLFLGSWRTVQLTVWKKARVWLPDDEAKDISKRFDEGYPELPLLGRVDIDRWAQRGYVQDGYGRRRSIPIPPGARYAGGRWEIAARTEDEEREIWKRLSHCFHMVANTPTQSMNASDNMWMLALAYHGEYTSLRVPPMWEERGGVLYPEAATWRFHEGPGPGGKPFRAWQTNTVHDSLWGDCAPGYLEAVMKVCVRRCTALPFDWRIKSDVPYRIDFQCGPDQAHLRDYNDVAKEFGMEPMTKR